ncbi:tetratricopeptide repeat protein [Maribacter sp. R77961]|uniref:tetratricopeptide repeat protein n=1 Tax=Maribacter sp. R77961 TaxID=3093871 RepID=UPI0037C74470
MKNEYIFLLFFLGTNFVPALCYAQEKQEIQIEESAEVFLEDYSDDFQENFFEALKQKGIQNYDRAINFLLECKRLQPDNKVVAYELAKNYHLDKKNIPAQEYAIEALNSDPGNYWYLHTLNAIVGKQGNTLSSLENEIPYKNDVLKENLAQIYFKDGKLEAALAVLNTLEGSKQRTALEQEINGSLQKKKAKQQTVSYTARVENAAPNSIANYKMRIKGLMNMTTANLLLVQLTEEALESYPSQPYFYYSNGYALNRSKKYRDAIEVLEAALDYLINDIALANKIYKELSDAYSAMSNPSKANMYLSKIKPGF